MTIMFKVGQTAEAIILVEVNWDGFAVALYVMALKDLRLNTRSTMIEIDKETALEKFAHAARGFFAKDTSIMLASGALKAIEQLKACHEIMTRDSEEQKIRWIGYVTMRASGEFAPVLIKAKTLNNIAKLVLGPEQGLLNYQRSDTMSAARGNTRAGAPTCQWQRLQTG